MQETLINYFGVQNFMPHGYCLGWDSPLLWLTVGSNLLMTLSYATYPIGIAYFVWKRKDLQYRWLYLGFFIAFILTCASTHLISVVTIWIPMYWLEAWLNVISALVATATVFAIWWVIPRALKLPSPAELQKARDAAEAANKAKSSFLASMSHELRTPLNAVLGFSELMSLDDSVTPAQKETLAIINRSGAHLLSMINDVLEISKIEAGRLELTIQAFNLSEFLNEIGVMVRVQSVAKQLSFRLELAPDIAQFIQTDSQKLRQVLINLLGNAIKFTQQGGVVLRARTQLLPSAVDKVMLIVEVSDSGMGIAEDKVNQLFKPFVQLAQSNADAQGTGLGLVISKSLIELMGGQISVRSEWGIGSTFTIELPVVITDKVDTSEEEIYREVKSLEPNQPLWRLLVVDDNADNRLLLSTLLLNMGFQVREAENGREAVRVFEDWQPHLIWMDMRMPEMDGYEATAKIRQLAGGDVVKIIALTASAFKEQHSGMVKAGCDAVLHKPINAPEIFAALSKYLSTRFLYQDQATSSSLPALEISTEMMSALPSVLRQQLYEAALKLDSEEIDDVITKIYNLAPDIAQSLKILVQNYQFKKIIQLVEDTE
jgi:signal transduction histidine kinase/CheY-like chemotaxis protein